MQKDNRSYAGENKEPGREKLQQDKTSREKEQSQEETMGVDLYETIQIDKRKKKE